MMSIVAGLAPRPLEALSTADMNAGSCAGPSSAAAQAGSSKDSQCSSSGKRKAQEGEDSVPDLGSEATNAVAEQAVSSKKVRADKQSSVSPSKRSEGSTPSEGRLSPEKVAAAQEKEEKRKQREAKKAEKAKKEAEKEAKRQKEAQMRKRAANFMSSFVQQRPKETTSPQKERNNTTQLSDYQRCFPPCSYKDIAPINRHHRSLDVSTFDTALQSPSEDTPNLLQNFIRLGKQAHSVSTKTSKLVSRKGVRAPVSVRDSMRLVTEAGVLGDEENGRRGLGKLADRKRVPMKLLHFESDRRPAWYGTWTRSSNFVGPRRPLGQDPVALDYTYDSDAEWEDVDPLDGDDVQDNDEQDDEDRCSRSDSDSEMSDWLVDDLEEEEDGDAMAEEHPALQMGTWPSDAPSVPWHSNKGVSPNKLELKAKRKKKKIIGRRFETKLIKFETGPHWEEMLGVPAYEGFRGYQMEMLNDAWPGLDPFKFVSAISEQPQSGSKGSVVDPNGHKDAKPEAPETSITPANNDSSSASSTATNAVLARAKTFPDEHISQLLREIEGKVAIRPILVEELRTSVASWGKVAAVTKTTLEACLTVYAEKLTKKAGGKWVVRQEYRPLAGLK